MKMRQNQLLLILVFTPDFATDWSLGKGYPNSTVRTFRGKEVAPPVYS